MTDENRRQLAAKLGMTADELREHIIRSAYENARMENPDITLKMIATAAASGATRGAITENDSLKR